MLEGTSSDNEDLWLTITGSGEDWQEAVEAEETGKDEEIAGGEEVAKGRNGTKLATAVVVTSDDIGREMWGTVAGDAQVKIPAEIANKEDIDRVAATVAARMTVWIWNGATETVREAKETGSMEKEYKTGGEEIEERIAAGEAWGE